MISSLAFADDTASHPSAMSPFKGEPVELTGNRVYFTSWRFVRPGCTPWTKDANSQAPSQFVPWDMPRGIRLVAQQATLVPPVPGQAIAHLYDQGKYKAWILVNSGEAAEFVGGKRMFLPGHNNYVGYAESTDGVHWVYPKLNLYEHAGSKDNNICFRDDLNGSVHGVDQCWVFVDPTSTEERFKMVYSGVVSPEEWKAFEEKYPGQIDPLADRDTYMDVRLLVAMFGAVSPDGIHWKALDEPLMIHHADTLNTCYYDADLKQYVAYVRTWQAPSVSKETFERNSVAWMGIGRRAAGRAFSRDFRHFDPPEMFLATTAEMKPSDVVYTNCKTTVPVSGDHIMFPWIWEMDRDGGTSWLYSSADGRAWSKVPGGPVMEHGPTGTATAEQIICKGNLLEFPDDTWRIACGAHPRPHKYPYSSTRPSLFPDVAAVEGYAVWPRGRLVALQADSDGEFTTVAIMPPGRCLRVNADVKPTGYLKVAVIPHGKGFAPGRGFDDCDRIVGSGLDMPVSWKGERDLTTDGKPTVLQFKMRQAKLFGLEFRDEQSPTTATAPAKP
jgi:hypothetical protein